LSLFYNDKSFTFYDGADFGDNLCFETIQRLCAAGYPYFSKNILATAHNGCPHDVIEAERVSNIGSNLPWDRIFKPIRAVSRS
ncbi:MAG: hypothetical protein PVI82_02715, partial [Desulfobacterales bacterium]|jgi:hypothetical protein